jgi:hypothetical protein
MNPSPRCAPCGEPTLGPSSAAPTPLRSRPIAAILNEESRPTERGAPWGAMTARNFHPRTNEEAARECGTRCSLQPSCDSPSRALVPEHPPSAVQSCGHCHGDHLHLPGRLSCRPTIAAQPGRGPAVRKPSRGGLAFMCSATASGGTDAPRKLRSHFGNRSWAGEADNPRCLMLSLLPNGDEKEQRIVYG